MRHGLALVLAALVGGPEPELSGRLVVEPPRAAIGEPTTWTLVVEHPRGDVQLAALPFADDPGWVLVEGPIVASERSPQGERTRFRWTVLALEAGRRELPPVAVRTPDGASIEVAGGVLEVTGELGPDEDAPRPLAGFHDVEERVGPLAPWQIALLVVVLVAALAAWRRWRRRAPAPAPAPDARERLAELAAAAPAAEGEGARALAFELSALVRGAVDAAHGAEHAGRTDEEWLAWVDAQPELAPLRADLSALLASCGEVKYGGRVPTRFALTELVERARRALDALAGDAGRRAA